MKMYLHDIGYKRIVKLMAILFFAMTSIVIVGTLQAAPAHAFSVDSGSIPGIGTTADMVTEGSSNAGGGGGFGEAGGGGGSAKPSQNPSFCANVNFTGYTETRYTCINQFSSTQQWMPNSENTKNYLKSTGLGTVNGCGSKMVGGFRVAPEGAIFVTVTEVIAILDDGIPRQRIKTSTVCVYPAGVQIKGVIVKCILSYSAAIDRTANSRLGTAARVMSQNKTLTTVDAIIANPSNCVTTYSAQTNYSPPTNQNAWGQYNASSQINYVRCQKGSTTFEGSTTELMQCFNTGSNPGQPSKLTIWCGGWVPTHIQKSWSASDCYGPSTFTCKIPTPATYNGISGTVQGIRDGKNSTVQWGKPTFTGGIRNDRNWKSLTNVNSGSTPYNGSYGVNDKSKQLFRSDNVNFGTWMGGQNLSQNLAFYTASNSGSPFSMTRNYKYDAEFSVSHTVISSYNITTGAIVASGSKIWVPDVNVPCGPQGSPKINVIRAVGDIVG